VLKHDFQIFLQKIPKGKVTTYRILAKKLGVHPRTVAALCKMNNPAEAPCYKVVMSDGRLGGYSGTGGVRRKERLLCADGIIIKKGRVDLKRFIYR
jgi:methylated-DNA-[protein]-cysteine S-methyltransferase